MPWGHNAGATVTRQATFDFPGNDVGSAYMYNIVDFDGASVAFPYPAIIGSHIDWWNVGCGCVRDVEWGVWICDKTPGREIGYLELDAPTVTTVPNERRTIEAHRHVGCCDSPRDPRAPQNCPVCYTVSVTCHMPHGTIRCAVRCTPTCSTLA